jgi:HNH endonuclease/AP2 domain
VDRLALTQEGLQQILHYHPRRGEFRWRPHEKSVHHAGQIAGSSMRSDYWCIHVDGRSYRAHQLAWLYMTGEWGRPQIAHRDGDPFNNRWRNLRLSACLDCPAPRTSNRSTPLVLAGIALDRRSGQWTARFSTGERVYSLGRFSTQEAAHEAYAIAARLLQREVRSG